MRPREASLLFVLLGAVLAGCASVPPVGAPPLAGCPAPCAFALATVPNDLWEPHVAADPRDPRRVVAAVIVIGGESEAEPFANGMLVAATQDGGATWTTTRIPHGPGAGPDHPLAGSRALADPNVAFLPDGTTLVSGLAYNLVASPVGGFAQGFRVFVARSSDGGATFPEVGVVVADSGVASITPLGHRAIALRAPDAPTMTVAPDGTVHLLWRTMTQATPAEPERSVMMHASSRDGARSWSTPAAIDTGERSAVAGQLVATRDGTLLAAVGGWTGGGVFEATTGAQLLARSTDGGGSWSVSTLAEEFAPGLAWFPTLAEGPTGILFAYPVASEDGRETVAVRTSTDGGATFGEPVTWTRAVAAGHAMPTLAGDGERALLTFFEPQVDGATRNHLYGIPINADGPGAPILLDASLTEDATHLGEYFGIAIAGDRAMPVWPQNGEGGELKGAWVTLVS